MKIGLFVLFVCIGATLARDLITVDPSGEGGRNTDSLAGSGLTQNFCVANNKECAGADLKPAKFAANARQCTINCGVEVTCLSAFFKDQKCHLRGARCAAGSLRSNNGGTDFYRLKTGESCPASRPQFVVQHQYSNRFCMMWGKACKNRNFYPKPQKLSTYIKCYEKCNRLYNCAMVDYYDGKCELIEKPCTDAQLTDAPNTRNFIRLPKSVPVCPSNRGPPTEEKPTVVVPPVAPAKPDPKPAPTAGFGCSFVDSGQRGHDISYGHQATPEECRRDCIDREDCVGSTWDTKNLCWLHFKIDNSRFYRASKYVLFLKSCPHGAKACQLPNSGHRGHDIKTGHTATPAQCVFDCQANPKCVGSTWDTKNKCWLHFKIERSRFYNANNYFLFLKDCSDRPDCVHENRGHRGLDLRQGYVVSHPVQCEIDCRHDSACVGSTYDKFHLCWKHYGIEAKRFYRAATYRLYLKTCQPMENPGCTFPNSGHRGNDIKGGYTAPPVTCASDCDHRADCKGMTWDTRNLCWLHHKVEESKYYETMDYALWFKTCPYAGCAFPNSGHRGNDIKSGYKVTPLRCAKDCDANPKCVGSTWDTRQLCWLHYKMETGKLYHTNKYVLYFKTCPYRGCSFPNSGHRGHDIRTGHTAEPYKCASDCDANPKCVAATWDTNNKCWLHFKIEKSRYYKANQYVFYLKDCSNLV